MRERKKLEAQLTPQQRWAAQMLVQNQLGELVNENGKRKTMQQIADELGVARSTLYEWKDKEEFVAYMNLLADHQLEAMRSEVYSALVKLIRGGPNGIPSVKALELYMRRFALLTDRSIVDDARDHVEARSKTDAEIRKEIAELDALINGYDRVEGE